MEYSSTVLEAFSAFISNPSLFALPLTLSENVLQHASAVTYPDKAQYSFQQALNRLDDVLNPRTALYLLLRRNNSLVVVTYTPYRADANAKKFLIDNRSHLINKLGEEHFSTSIICKEIGEIADARSWNERDGEGSAWGDQTHEDGAACKFGDASNAEKTEVRDLGFRKNQCRLCDRRMKNNIDDDALEALTEVKNAGDCVQLSVDIATEVLKLNFQFTQRTPSQVAFKLPTDRPSFTFYRHISNKQLYFIFCSPDCASVKERMKHTMAIPGLVNIIMKDMGVEVDQKIEIHDPEDLTFEGKNERIGKFRSMYLRNEVVGTESRWEDNPTA
ncbi:hypothetical protein P280DRAFT_481918 [Massarina eburnea CBS 473.64]|uniref:ADF-H domain-containing protein n=1 Tax=Massarina eburnea CBS 473.64 TaxID=1395130 RepID=A0A6A6RVW8_9PLEO|nr:hypothetical protein P280DRAFT_481918 [Massarina eburnea CBS 473.64]